MRGVIFYKLISIITCLFHCIVVLGVIVYCVGWPADFLHSICVVYHVLSHCTAGTSWYSSFIIS